MLLGERSKFLCIAYKALQNLSSIYMLACQLFSVPISFTARSAPPPAGLCTCRLDGSSVLLLLVKSYSFFQCQTIVSLLLPTSRSVRGFSSAPTPAGPFICYCCSTAIIFTCVFQLNSCFLDETMSFCFCVPNAQQSESSNMLARRNLFLSIFCWSKGYIFRRLIYMVITWIKLNCKKQFREIVKDLKLFDKNIIIKTCYHSLNIYTYHNP